MNNFQPKHPELIKALIASAQLVRVDLQSCVCNATVYSGNINPKNTDLAFAREITWQLDEAANVLVCRVGFTATGTPVEKKDGEKYFTLGCVFWAYYSNVKKDFGNEALEFFAQNNAAMNVHGYAREFMDSLSRRMGLIPVTLPLLRPVTATVKEGGALPEKKVGKLKKGK